LLEFAVADADFRVVEPLCLGMDAKREKRAADDEWMNVCHAQTIPRSHETLMKAL
jgi:hypothetical protein